MSEPTKGSRPAFEIYYVQPAPKKHPHEPERKGFFTKVGAAWPTDKGTGFNIKLNALPVGFWDGKLVMVPPYEDGQQPPELDEEGS